MNFGFECDEASMFGVSKAASLGFVVGDIVAMARTKKGCIGYVKHITDDMLHVVPIELSSDNKWIRSGPERALQPSVVTKIPDSVTSMQIRL